MDSLSAGKQYQLSINEENRCNKSVILVKLTDSMAKSIEEFQKNIGYSNPKIQFEEHGGVIQFPSNNEIQKYNFILSDIEGKENDDGNNLPKRGVVCVQQDKNGSLESLGSMIMKMQIRAKEDSYESTKFKVAAAEKVQKQFCAKEIKPSGSHIGNQIRVNHPKNIIVPSNSHAVPSAISIWQTKSKNDVRPAFNSPNVYSAKHDSNTSTRLKTVHPAKPANVPLAKHETILEPIPSFIASNISSARPAILSATKPASITSMSPESKLENTVNIQKKENIKSKIATGIQRQPLRERMIHLLALKPYKRIEILQKLKSEGVNKNDKNNISIILAQVSILKKNCYYLSDGFWNEVQDNWKFYSPEEAEAVRKNKQLQLQKKSLPYIQPSVPAKEHSPKEVIMNTYPPSKKQRISRFNGSSSQEHKQHGNPETSIKSPSFPNTGDSHRLQIKGHNSCIKISNINPKSNGINSFKESPELSRPNIDNSPSTQSSGYASQSPDQSFTTQPSNSEKQCYRELSFSDWNGSSSKITRAEGSKLNSGVGNGKRKSLQKLSDQSFKQRMNKKRPFTNHSISSNTGFKRNDNLRSFPGKYSTSECEKEDLKIIVTRTAEQGFKIKDTKSIKLPKESCITTLKNPNQISPLKSAVPNLPGNHRKFHSCTPYNNTKHHLQSSNGDMTTHPVSCSSKSSAECIKGKDKTNPVPPGKQFEKQSEHFKQQFVKIESQEQRNHYKALHNAELPLANKLQCQITKIYEHFVVLEKKLAACQKGSEEYQRMEEKIHADYKATIEYEFKRKKGELIHLYEKLTYIRKLIEEYDKGQQEK